MREPLPFVRCNVVYYGALDFRDLAERFSVDRTRLEPYEAVSYVRHRGSSVPPMLIAKAGADDSAINGSIDRFVAAAREVGAPVELVTHPTGPHGFDVRARGAASRRIIRRTLAFFRAHLRGSFAPAARRPRPLRLLEPCVTRRERRGIVRFRAGDRTRLIGVLLGSGPNVVVLAHQGGGGAPGDLCAWISYARRLRAAGSRVFVFDHRAHGSSGVPAAVQRYTAVDLDVAAAVRLVRARGARRVVLGGASLGGAAVLGGAARLVKPVDGVFTVGGTHSFGVVDVHAALRKLTVPLLFVAAEEDSGGQFAQEAREMYDESVSPVKRLEIFPGRAHGAPQLRDPAVRTLVDGWIREKLPLG
jgi:alpha-beta hydrolase superfamily lysophospholipase